MKAISDTIRTTDTHAFELDDETLLFQPQSGRIFRLNPMASVIWQGLSAGISIHDIVTALVQSTGGNLDRIAADIDHLVLQWRRLGLLEGKRAVAPVVRASSPLIDQDVELADDETIQPYPADGPKLAFRVIDTDFLIEVSTPGIWAVVEPLISHLKITERAQLFIRLSVVLTNIRYVLLKDGVPVDWCSRKNGIAPMVHANALMAAYDMANCLIGLHSAAMEINGKCILLPALSGSGKSTLTAALVGAGFRYLADDLVLLTHAPVHMRPVPVAIGIKKGAWPLLAPYLPSLATLSTHRRADEKLVRYLVPGIESRDDSDARPRLVHAIVFPKYEKNAPLTLNPISRAEALCRIADAGYDAHSGLTLDFVNQLIRWIAATPSFELGYDSLDQAVDAIGSEL